VEPDEQVECPTCAREFSLDRAVLRAIPEVVRRGHTAESPFSTKKVETAKEVEPPAAISAPDVIVEDAKHVAATSDLAETSEADDADFVEHVKSRIERELAAGGLLPGMSGDLSLELPDSLEEPYSLASAAAEPLDQWHRPTVRLHELTELEDEPPQQADEESADEPQAAAEPDHEIAADASEYTPSESVAARPAATTLADLMPPVDEISEPDEMAIEPGPSFELPNVQLTPTNSATVEFNPAATYGPSAESEFELDNVDFASTPTDSTGTQSAVVEGQYDEDEYAVDSAEAYSEQPTEYADEPAEYEEEVVESDAPVFSEPPANPPSNAPYVLPSLPPRRRKRSVVRTLVGTALGGIVGALAAGYSLLWILGPDGDFLQVAKYLPSAVLPKSFQATPAPVVAQSQPSPAAEARPMDADPEETENIPATFTAEVDQPAEDSNGGSTAASDEPASDNRSGDEPSPLVEPAAEPIAEVSAATPPPLPLRGPIYTVDQLATAFDDAAAAQPGLISGDLSDAAVRRTKGMSYAKLCDLAEALTFVERISASVESEQASAGAQRLFRETLSDPHTRSEVDRIAAIWIDSPHRRHGGVFLAGTLRGGEIAGDVYEYELTTDDGGKIALLAAEPLGPIVESSQRPVGIVGSIVAHPAADVAGYHGTADRAIWVTRAIPLD